MTVFWLILGAAWLHGFLGGLLVSWLARQFRRRRMVHHLRALLASKLGKTD